MLLLPLDDPLVCCQLPLAFIVNEADWKLEADWPALAEDVPL